MEPRPDDLVIVLSTLPADDRAAPLARALVEERLCACVNLIPGLTSVFRWQGALDQADETLAVIKTTRDRLDALTARLTALHPYDLPEVIAVPLAGGHPPYLAWVAAETRPAPAGG